MVTLKHCIRQTYQGATSLLVTMAVAMMLIVIIAGIAAFSIREQRQASNTEQSNKALQTAEAGIYDAVQQLSSNPNINQTNCTKVDIFNDPNQQITCRTITTQFTSVEGALERDQATQIQIFAPNSSEAPTSMQLRWHSTKLDPVLSQYFFSGQFYPALSGYNNAAAIELTFIYWPRTNGGQNIDQAFLNDPANHNNGLRIATRYFMPGQADKANSSVDSGCIDQSTTNKVNLGSNYRCVTNSNSAVGFDLTPALNLPKNSDQFDYIVRIKTRYADTHFQVKFFHGNKEINVKSTKALIDVTAKSGNLYRRVQAEKPIIPTSLENLFDSVLYAGRGSNDQTDKNICKNMVIDGTNQQLITDNNCP